MTTEPEIVALVKTRSEYFDAVAAAVKETVPYTNFVGQLEVARINEGFAAWLNDVVCPAVLSWGESRQDTLRGTQG